jgi:acetyl esterase
VRRSVVGMTNYRTTSDDYSGRPVAEDSWPTLKAFRDGGCVSHEKLPLEEGRRRYTTPAAPLQDADPAMTEYPVEDCRVRVYDPRPSAEQDAPTSVILFLHGGGWALGGFSSHHSLARRLCVRSGLPLVAVDYRLAPEHRYPAAVEDARAALRWLVRRADVHGLRVTGMSVAGDSAGGNLAAVLANEATAGTVPGVEPMTLDAQVLLYPVTDLTDDHMTGGASYRRITEGFPLTAATMRWFGDLYIDHGPVRRAADASPMYADLPAGLPPTFLVSMDNDPLADDGVGYAAKLAAAGTPLRHDHLVGYPHGVFTAARAVPTAEHYVNLAADFLAEHADGARSDPRYRQGSCAPGDARPQ